MTVLVTGGAGFIGSHMVLALRDRGERVVVLDDLSTGVRSAVPADVALEVGSVGDQRRVRRILGRYEVDAVLHFAGSVVVPESVSDPLDYYLNNTANSRTLIAACVRAGIGSFIFSSTAAVYGSPRRIPIPETAPLDPISPYGSSKLMTERILADCGAAYGLRHVALRYFNVTGADPYGRAGQSTANATHLMKVACEVATGRRPALTIFGTDYETADGTAIRDYIHVSDLVEAHLAALDHLRNGGPSAVLNCGYGRGYSVREVAAAVGRAAGQELPVVEGRRRAGDPAAVIADTTEIRRLLAWRPCHDDLDLMAAHALAWERRLAELRPALSARPSPTPQAERLEIHFV